MRESSEVRYDRRITHGRDGFQTQGTSRTPEPTCPLSTLTSRYRVSASVLHGGNYVRSARRLGRQVTRFGGSMVGRFKGTRVSLHFWSPLLLVKGPGKDTVPALCDEKFVSLRSC